VNLSERNLEGDFLEATTAGGGDRWKLTRPAPLEVHAVVSSGKHPEERFTARLLWTHYPDSPPSLKFIDAASGRLDLPSAWPMLRGFRPASLDTCVNWTSEGMNLHPEWRDDPKFRWDRRGNVLLRTLQTLIAELDEFCEGRHK